ncbi:unnamed protein product [Periconia digitata]|uniref:Uncharacterized protein n=1 Tax=Periconia digitata TaxID=1303443 RepID=A0A9W4U7E1_9PLEO|nr:unnamed protein product [Periconia digitata]
MRAVEEAYSKQANGEKCENICMWMAYECDESLWYSSRAAEHSSRDGRAKGGGQRGPRGREGKKILMLRAGQGTHEGAIVWTRRQRATDARAPDSS